MLDLIINLSLRISENQRAAYGKEIVQSLSEQLTGEFGRGFGCRNIFNMVRFAEVFPEAPIVQTLSAQLGWAHFSEILPLKDDLQRDFHAEMCRGQGHEQKQKRDDESHHV